MITLLEGKKAGWRLGWSRKLREFYFEVWNADEGEWDLVNKNDEPFLIEEALTLLVDRLKMLERVQDELSVADPHEPDAMAFVEHLRDLATANPNGSWKNPPWLCERCGKPSEESRAFVCPLCNKLTCPSCKGLHVTDMEETTCASHVKGGSWKEEG